MYSISEDIIEQFHDSLERCGPATEFLGRFYQLFIASSPEIAVRFADTNLKAQARVLKTSFYMAMLASDQCSEAQEYLDRIAKRHSHLDLDIKPEFYDLWLDSMIAVVAESDPQFDADIELAWRVFMGPAIEFMKSRY